MAGLVRRAMRTASLAIAGVGVAAMVSAASASGATFGYVYTGSLSAPSGNPLQGFAVNEHGELSLVTGVKAKYPYVLGVATATTASGVYAYSLSTLKPGSTSDEIDAFKVDTSDGALSHIGEVEANNACKIPGDPGLLAFDQEGAGPVTLFAVGCEYPGDGETVSVKEFTVDTSTGAVASAGGPSFLETEGANGIGLAGNQLTFAYEAKRQTFLQPALVNEVTGTLEATGGGLALGGAQEGKSTGLIGASTLGVFALGNFGPDEANVDYPPGVGQFAFDNSFADVTPRTTSVQALAYAPAALIAGEEGPRIEFVLPGSVGGTGSIDLTQPPTSLPPYTGEFDSDAIGAVYPLGPFIYVGIYGIRTVQLIAEPGKKATFPEEAFAAGSGANVSVDAIAGFLTGSIPAQKAPPQGSAEKTGEQGTGEQIKLKAAITKAIVLSGAAKAKLKSGEIKLYVTCGLPCAVAGAVLPPGAKAGVAADEPAFKTVHLSGSGKPVLVSLKFTRAQKKLIARLLKRHKKARVRITVTEAPGGAAPQLKTVNIT